jgi:uncharacterized lipoprotein YmbA
VKSLLPQLVLRSAILTACACLLAIGGCVSTQPSRFYLLTPLPRLEATPQVPPGARGPAIGVGPVILPKYLDRPQIVTHASSYEVSVAEFERWAEPLEVNFARVFAENLASLIPTDRLAMYPWPRSTPIDYQVTLEVVEFLGRLGGESALIARWTLSRGEGQEVLASRKSGFSATVGGGHLEK